MRLFAAVFVPEQISQQIHKHAVKISELFKTKAVPVSNMHITLKFFGEKDPENCLKILGNSVKNIKSFETAVAGFDFFSYGNFASVLWAAVNDETASLSKIALNIDSSRKDYIPHVTLARFKNDTAENAGLKKFIEDNNLKNTLFGKFRVAKISLVESIMAGGEVRYGVLENFELGE